MTDLSVLATLEVDAVADPVARHLIRTLLALFEQLAAENVALRAENQRLKDENARLKGEQGMPTVRPQSRRPGTPTNVSSEQQRREPTVWRKGTKRDTLTITRTERLRVDPATLPADAVFKGDDSVVVQDLKVEVDTVCSEQEVWYSPSQRRRDQAAVPAGYEGAFGPGLKTLALAPLCLTP